MVGEDEVIDEFGNQWNPQDHPRRDEKIGNEPLGVSINIDGVAKIFKLGPQEFEICYRRQLLRPSEKFRWILSKHQQEISLLLYCKTK